MVTGYPARKSREISPLFRCLFVQTWSPGTHTHTRARGHTRAGDTKLVQSAECRPRQGVLSRRDTETMTGVAAVAPRVSDRAAEETGIAVAPESFRASGKTRDGDGNARVRRRVVRSRPFDAVSGPCTSVVTRRDRRFRPSRGRIAAHAPVPGWGRRGRFTKRYASCAGLEGTNSPS